MTRFREAADLERNHCFANGRSADFECDFKIPPDGRRSPGLYMPPAIDAIIAVATCW